MKFITSKTTNIFSISILLLYYFVPLFISNDALAQDASVLVSAKAYAPTTSQREALGYGNDKITAMNDACDRYSEDDAYVEGSEGGRLECLIQEDGNRYTCYSGFGDEKSWIGACATYAVRNCSGASSDYCYPLPRKNIGCGELDVGNPCNVSTGNKHQTLTIMSSGSLRLTLTYNSQDYSNTDWFGDRWISNHSLRAYYSQDQIFLVRGNGSGERWEKIDDHWVGDIDSKVSLIESPTNLVTFYNDDAGGTDLIVVYDDGSKEVYGDIEFTGGQIYQSVSPQGQVVTYNYEDDGVVIISDEYGNFIKLRRGYTGGGTWAGPVDYVEDGLANRIYFQYLNNHLLELVTYPDLTPNISTDNPVLRFQYEDQNYPLNLTGITDENGDRYATYEYDVDGKTIITEHAQTTNSVGQEKFELGYQEDN